MCTYPVGDGANRVLAGVLGRELGFSFLTELVRPENLCRFMICADRARNGWHKGPLMI